jgi:hypothetical protein
MSTTAFKGISWTIKDQPKPDDVHFYGTSFSITDEPGSRSTSFKGFSFTIQHLQIASVSIVDKLNHMLSWQISNAVLTDSFGRNTIALTFAANSLVANEIDFSMEGVLAAHLLLTFDITYEIVAGRPITETVSLQHLLS